MRRTWPSRSSTTSSFTTRRTLPGSATLTFVGSQTLTQKYKLGVSSATVRNELAELEAALPRAAARLATGGRLAVISFHSLEDRIVKRFIAAQSTPFAGDPRLARLPLTDAQMPQPPLVPVGRARKVTAAEASDNPRSRSAILRVAKRLATSSKEAV